MSSKEEEYIIVTLSKINKALRCKVNLPEEFFTILAMKVKRYMKEITYNPNDETYTGLTSDQRKQVSKIGDTIKKLYAMLQKTYGKRDVLVAMQTFSSLVLDLLNEIGIKERMRCLTIT